MEKVTIRVISAATRMGDVNNTLIIKGVDLDLAQIAVPMMIVGGVVVENGENIKAIPANAILWIETFPYEGHDCTEFDSYDRIVRFVVIAVENAT